ncbi:uncharacterized protein LOC143229599 [Tachypleus tridentatus]|uniref:uncharacterized protein LOC143229599 n=1 Tax=Tachypleus tridentatus TaxID=6853 RepID=UPI003FD566DB
MSSPLVLYSVHLRHQQKLKMSFTVRSVCTVVMLSFLFWLLEMYVDKRKTQKALLKRTTCIGRSVLGRLQFEPSGNQVSLARASANVVHVHHPTSIASVSRR